jgi:hypothetical protein
MNQAVDVVQNPIVSAHQMRLAGHSWPEIASRLGYASAESVRVSVSQFLSRSVALVDDEDRLAALETELARLDALQLAVWPAALAGDTKAVDAALRVMDRRAKLLRLDQEPPEKPVTLLVRADHYIEDLQAAIDEREKARS